MLIKTLRILQRQEGLSSTITSRSTTSSSSLTGVGASIKTTQSIPWAIHIRLSHTPTIGRSSSALFYRGKVVHVWTTLLSTVNNKWLSCWDITKVFIAKTFQPFFILYARAILQCAKNEHAKLVVWNRFVTWPTFVVVIKWTLL